MEQTHKSDEDIQKEIDGLFEKTIRTPSGRNKDISVYAEWESFFQKLLTDYDADRQKKYIFYWAEKAFQDLPNRNAPLFSKQSGKAQFSNSSNRLSSVHRTTAR